MSFNEYFEKIIFVNKEYIQLKNKTVNEKYEYESYFVNHKINNYDENEQTK